MRLQVILALGCMLVGSGYAQERRYRDQIMGTAAPSVFDTNGDGVPAHYVTFSGTSNYGPVHGAFLVEYDFLKVAPHADCAAGTVKIPIVVSASTRAITVQDSQLFLKDDSESARFCLNPNTGSFTMSLKGSFTGGTGRFQGAGGTYEYRGGGQVLVTDKAGLPFGGFSVTTEGVVRLP